ncbi:hypothetical protein DPMN_026064 [Dreissena polymorpha]|uniref:Uncharacterized protein n=1 Tax=Dreissena polymorpha TaxID=45954 RepID=A0A9D4RC82_DREPO|nr:hypothetical protein DPMN_026064 [Dreissena polymorpha]
MHAREFTLRDLTNDQISVRSTVWILTPHVEGADIVAAKKVSQKKHLEKKHENIREELFLRSQSTRNNFSFKGIPEVIEETQEVTKRKLRKHFYEALKIAKETADSMQLIIVHLSPGLSVQ